MSQELVSEAFSRLAPRTKPAMSTISTLAGMTCWVLITPLSLSRLWIRHWNDTCVRLDGAEGVVRALRTRRSQRVEEGALADVGQTDDSSLKCHGGLL